MLHVHQPGRRFHHIAEAIGERALERAARAGRFNRKLKARRFGRA